MPATRKAVKTDEKYFPGSLKIFFNPFFEKHLSPKQISGIRLKIQNFTGLAKYRCRLFSEILNTAFKFGRQSRIHTIGLSL